MVSKNLRKVRGRSDVAVVKGTKYTPPATDERREMSSNEKNVAVSANGETEV